MLVLGKRRRQRTITQENTKKVATVYKKNYYCTCMSLHKLTARIVA